MSMLNTRVVTQIGLVVRDIEASAAAWAKVLGQPAPPVIVTDPEPVAHTRYRGQATQATAKLAFFQLGQVSLELIQPIGGPSTWQEVLDQRGEGVHHIALKIEGSQQVLARLDAAGMPLIQKGDFTGGRYFYVDAEPQLKVILELLEDVPPASSTGGK
jgi:hypothetical protein